MSARDWTTLAFRLIGIYLILGNLIQIPIAVSSIESTAVWGEMSGMTFTSWSTMIGSMLLPFVIGYLLLRQTDWFVDKAFASVLRGRQEIESEEDVDGVDSDNTVDGTMETATTVSDDEWVTDFREIGRDDLQAILFSLMGVWILSSALPEAFSYLTEFFRQRSEDLASNFAGMFLAREAFGLTFVFTRVALGLWLFLSSYSITRLWRRRQQKRVAIVE